jgi:hypothetical protein
MGVIAGPRLSKIKGGIIMRALLVKSSMLILIILALGSGLTLAATSSKPGMFLYPIKQTTQKLTGAAASPMTPVTPRIELPQQGAGQPPSANVNPPSENIQEEVAQEPEITEPGQIDEATATPAPMPARIVDEIAVIAKPGEVPSGDPVILDNLSSSPAIDQLGSGSVDDGHNNDGQADTGGRSNDKDDGHSDSEHDGESDDGGEDHHD